MKLSTLSMSLKKVVAGLCMVLVFGPAAQSAGSLSDLDIENSQLKVAIEKVLRENKELRDALGETAKALTDSRQNLADVNGESEIFRNKTMQMRLRMDALGIDLIAGNAAKLEQRLLAALNDLRASTGEKAKLSESLIRLTEAASLYARTATGTDLESRLSLEAEIRRANSALGASSIALEVPTVASAVSEGMIISVKDDLALVVMNVGDKHGVKVGMPFRVVRKDKLVGRVRVVDVREKISGAVLQNLSSEKEPIRVGDRLKVDAQQ